MEHGSERRRCEIFRRFPDFSLRVHHSHSRATLFLATLNRDLESELRFFREVIGPPSALLVFVACSGESFGFRRIEDANEQKVVDVGGRRFQMSGLPEMQSSPTGAIFTGCPR